MICRIAATHMLFVLYVSRLHISETIVETFDRSRKKHFHLLHLLPRHVLLSEHQVMVSRLLLQHLNLRGRAICFDGVGNGPLVKNIELRRWDFENHKLMSTFHCITV